jgi:hypothetical protein
MIINPGGLPNASNSPRIREVKQWVYERLQLPEEATVMVTELRCTEPDCPPLETVIVVMEPEKPSWQFKIHKPVADVQVGDIDAIGEPHSH